MNENIEAMVMDTRQVSLDAKVHGAAKRVLKVVDMHSHWGTRGKRGQSDDTWNFVIEGR